METVQTHVLRLVAPIGDHRPSISMDEACRAVAPRVPVDNGLHLSLEPQDGTEAFYRHGIEAIQRRVQGFIEHHVGATPTNHLSIFGFAPMPLLMLLGRTVGDKQPADVYERHRHKDSWCWDEDGPSLEWTLNFPQRPIADRDVALLLSISDAVSPVAVGRTLGSAFDVVEITLPQPQRVPNIVRTRGQLREFAEMWRSTLNQIKAAYTRPRVHVFPAAPLSVCVECGRRLLPKADPELAIYDRFNDRFLHALTLRAPELHAPDGPKPLMPRGQAQSWRPGLASFFSSAFEPFELGQLLTELDPGIRDFLLNGDQVSKSRFGDAAFERLVQRGLINEHLFEVILGHFTSNSDRRTEIEQIRRDWRHRRDG